MNICWHKYGKWSKLVPAYEGIFQYAICAKCGKCIKRKSGNRNSHNLAVWNTDRTEDKK